MPLPVGPKSELKPSGGQMRRRERGLELHVARAGRIRRVRFVGDDDTRRASSTRATRRARLWRGRNCDNRGGLVVCFGVAFYLGAAPAGASFF